MEGVHAVFNMATAPSHQQAMLAGRFQALLQRIEATGSEAQRRSFAVGLARLLFAAVQAMAVSPNPKVARMSPATVVATLTSLMQGQPADVLKVARMAAGSRLVADFIRSIGDPPPRPDLLATAAAVILRDVLRSRGGQTDMLQQWTLFGQLSNAVLTAHHMSVLRGSRTMRA